MSVLFKFIITFIELHMYEDDLTFNQNELHVVLIFISTDVSR